MGEHAVLQGAPGIALPLPGAMRARAHPNKTGRIRLFPAVSDPRMEPALEWICRNLGGGFDFFWEARVPVGAGLGSSASLSNLLVRWALALNHPEKAPDPRAVHAAVHELENLFHGRASGIDDSVVCREHPVMFQKPRVTQRWPFFHEPIDETLWRIEFPAVGTLVVAYSRSCSSTLEMVRLVQSRDDGTFAGKSARLVENAVIALEAGRISAFGRVLDDAHALLREAGASTPELETLVRLARGAGALGAKLTGAGGGGCALALAPDGMAARTIAEVWQEAGFPVVATLELSPSVSL